MKVTAKHYIASIESYKPGKSKVNNDKKVIKLSSNENALKTSPKVIQAFKDYATQLHFYPDGNCTELRETIAKKYKIDMARIVCGAGSDEIIGFLTQGFAGVGDEVLYSEHGFLMYPIAAKRIGAKPVIAKETNLTIDTHNILSQVTSKTKIIFIANPNNPTGSYVDNIRLEKLIEVLPKHIIIVLDLAYAEFASATDYPDGISLVNKYENVVMTRTFSKIYGIASLRLGWSYSSLYIADILNKTRGPFNVSGPAQYVGIAAVNDDEFIEKSRIHNDKWLKIVRDMLMNMGFKTYPSIANFILIDFLSPDMCQKMNEVLLDNGIILREMGGYGLPSCLRMTIGTEEENLLVMKILSQSIK